MKKRTKIALGAVGTVVLALVLVYGSLVLFADPLAGTEDEASAIQVAMEVMGLESTSWRTVVIAASGKSSASPESVWEAFADLESWSEWSAPLHEGAEWVSGSPWELGSEFAQDLDLGIGGKMTSSERITTIEPGALVMWCKDEDGLKSCHIWTFAPTDQGGTFITNVEVFDGASVAVMKPLIVGSMNDRFESSVSGLIERSESL